MKLTNTELLEELQPAYDHLDEVRVALISADISLDTPPLCWVVEALTQTEKVIESLKCTCDPAFEHTHLS